MADRKYKLGVIGLGEGRSIISAAMQSERWELTNVCDLNEDLCKERIEEFGLLRYTTHYDDLLSDPDIEVIAIYTPDQLHGRHIKQALEAGKHVIVTKPLLHSLEDASSLLLASKAAGKLVFVGQSTRFFEPMIHQRRDFLAGRHGEVDTVETYYISDSRWFLQRDWSLQKGFSWLHNFMSHAVDLARWYIPCIEEVFGYGHSSKVNQEYGLTCPDTLRFLLKDEVGRIAQVSGSYTKPTLRQVDSGIGCTLRGSKGTSRALYSKLLYHTHFAGEEPTTHSFEEKRSYYFRFEGESHHAGEYQNYIEYFADCLDQGVTPMPDLNEGIHTLAIMAAMERSIQTRQPVLIDDILQEYSLQEIRRSR
ncbi:Gfo/Idh/MocA family protein [Paenibacillus allorhizosphaerae]|uniref:Inositol 2-dehydrogenase/D-chiro-inositol 3-dehydrogenase n=1 Tax=Paenibacillus allorhizosphaerae TaxID=2849866 RepID=A0ABM8V9L1_9BACL|nr:Gfo/Idh/MocA family oxidoreductase [Paenibacillus allorhizosphaerae]CAG7613756.1 Inositol 2-dehydrogenase/D-chiro-inositol 3-dehydrogenase [Paenibacillus allorhizosphaerae]